MGKSKRKGRSKADRDALREAFSDVKPLNRGSNKRVMPSTDERPPRDARVSTARKPAESLLVQRDGDGILFGRRRKVHSSITDALGDPRLEIEAECDLHGMTVVEADRAVSRFVRTQQQRGRRWVLIIVGKGLHSPDGKGTLREHIVDTLSTRAAARYVLAFRTAPRRHGGAGALAARLVDRVQQ